MKLLPPHASIRFICTTTAASLYAHWVEMDRTTTAANVHPCDVPNIVRRVMDRRAAGNVATTGTCSRVARVDLTVPKAIM
mmetsp:Transcript_3763/g.6639  ORF Transcript_3763/g.6639 Transcript_3763/m.6639 type:complete len:80 (+) Transcript_3763:168-407(+)